MLVFRCSIAIPTAMLFTLRRTTLPHPTQNSLPVLRLTTYRVDVSCPLCEAPFRAHCLTPRCMARLIQLYAINRTAGLMASLLLSQTPKCGFLFYSSSSPTLALVALKRALNPTAIREIIKTQPMIVTNIGLSFISQSSHPPPFLLMQ